jgi:hypothetical protein
LLHHVGSLYILTYDAHKIPFPVEYKAEMKLGMSPCMHPLINENSHVLASDSKNGLSKYICADQHMTPQTTANLLLCCI